MELIGTIWNEVIIRPMINSLVLLYYVFFSNFGIGIIMFTIMIRAIMIPLTIKQGRQMRAMSALQPLVQTLQAKYTNDRARIQRETMKLYKEHGVNPLGCLGPLVIQMPIFFGLFWSLRNTLPSTPERLAELAEKLYSWLPMVHEVVPLDGVFLWMDLAKFSSENPIPLLLPILVGASMFVMQKMTPVAGTSPQQQSTTKMMLYLMPLMFGFFTLSFEAGLALYWIVSNIVGIVIQGFITGWGPLVSLVNFRQPQESIVSPTGTYPAEKPVDEEAETNERDRDYRKDVGRGDRDRSKGTRRRTRRGRNKRR